MQRELVASSDGLDESDPLALGNEASSPCWRRANHPGSSRDHAAGPYLEVAPQPPPGEYAVSWSFRSRPGELTASTMTLPPSAMGAPGRLFEVVPLMLPDQAADVDMIVVQECHHCRPVRTQSRVQARRASPAHHKSRSQPPTPDPPHVRSGARLGSFPAWISSRDLLGQDAVVRSSTWPYRQLSREDRARRFSIAAAIPHRPIKRQSGPAEICEGK